MSESNPFIKIQRKEPLSHKVEGQIRHSIRQKVFLPGDKLPGEFELAEKFRVSRTAVREALRMLSGRGLVEIRKGSGVYVSEIDMSFVVDSFYDLLELKCGKNALLHIIKVRLMIEPEIARLAAEHRSAEDVVFLEQNYSEMEMHMDDPWQNIEIDIKFHRRIASATNNPLIPVMMEPIFQLLNKFISSTYKQSHAGELAIDYHRLIANAIRDQDGQRAMVAMRDHLKSAIEHVTKYYKSIGFQEVPR